MSSKKLTIVLADDDQDDHYLFTHAIKEFNPEVNILQAFDGVQLLELLNDEDRQLPDIVFLDLNMPMKNGMDSLKEIRETERTRDLPIVICSTADSENNINMAFNFGANLYLQKPYSLTQLVSSMKVILNFCKAGNFPRFPRATFFYKG